MTEQPTPAETGSTAFGAPAERPAGPSSEAAPSKSSPSQSSPSKSSSSESPPDPSPKDPLRGSKASGLYAGVIVLGVLLILLIIFIAQNTKERPAIHFLWLDGHTSVAVMLLIAAAAGLFIAGIASLIRILQLRGRVKSERKARKRR